MHILISQRNLLQQYPLAEYLLSKAANPDTPDALGQSPFMHACRLGYADLVELMVEFGANLTLRYL